MLNNKENNLPTWIFFSNVDATLVNESARQLLAWSGESFGRLRCVQPNSTPECPGIVHGLRHDFVSKTL